MILHDDDVRKPYDQAYGALTDNKHLPNVKKALLAMEILFAARMPLSARSLLDAVDGARRLMDKEEECRAKPCKRPDILVEADDLIRSSRGLLVHDESLDLFRLFHPSFHFFLDKPGYEGKAHGTVTAASLKALETADTPVRIYIRGRGPSREPSRPSSSRRSSRSSSRISRNGSRDSISVGWISESDFNDWSSSEEDCRDPKIDHGDLQHSSGATRRAQNAILLAAHRRWSNPSGRTRARSEMPIQQFEEYAAIFVAHHFDCWRSLGEIVDPIFAKSQERLKRGLQELFTNSSGRWIPYVQKLLSQRPVGHYDYEVENQLQDCISHEPNGLFASCVYGHVEIVDDYVKSAKAEVAKMGPLPDGSSEIPNGLESANERGLFIPHIASLYG